MIYERRLVKLSFQMYHWHRRVKRKIKYMKYCWLHPGHSLEQCQVISMIKAYIKKLKKQQTWQKEKIIRVVRCVVFISCFSLLFWHSYFFSWNSSGIQVMSKFHEFLGSFKQTKAEQDNPWRMMRSKKLKLIKKHKLNICLQHLWKLCHVWRRYIWPCFKYSQQLHNLQHLVQWFQFSKSALLCKTQIEIFKVWSLWKLFQDSR